MRRPPFFVAAPRSVLSNCARCVWFRGVRAIFAPFIARFCRYFAIFARLAPFIGRYAANWGYFAPIFAADAPRAILRPPLKNAPEKLRKRKNIFRNWARLGLFAPSGLWRG